MSDYDTKLYPHFIHGDPVSNLMVMQSAAGYYIGREYWDTEFQFPGPYSRESGYYRTREEAQSALQSGDWEVRDCIENNAAYMNGTLPKPRDES
jgi:hypothetical protein